MFMFFDFFIVDYFEGFQGNFIIVVGKVVVDLIEDCLVEKI